MANITKIQLRRDTTSNWTANNPTLSSGEIGIDLDNNRLKIGNGVSGWTSLTYVGSSAELKIYTITGYTELTIQSYQYIRCLGGDYQVMLPEAIGTGNMMHIKKINSGTITLIPFSSNTIEGSQVSKDVVSGASAQLIDGVSGGWEVN